MTLPRPHADGLVSPGSTWTRPRTTIKQTASVGRPATRTRDSFRAMGKAPQAANHFFDGIIFWLASVDRATLLPLLLIKGVIGLYPQLGWGMVKGIAQAANGKLLLAHCASFRLAAPILVASARMGHCSGRGGNLPRASRRPIGPGTTCWQGCGRGGRRPPRLPIPRRRPPPSVGMMPAPLQLPRLPALAPPSRGVLWSDGLDRTDMAPLALTSPHLVGGRA